MTILAMCLTSVIGACPTTSQYILTVSHWLKMVRVHAKRVSTQVIEFFIFRYLSVKTDKHHSMNKGVAAFFIIKFPRYLSVSMSSFALPFPTTVSQRFDFLE